MTLLVPSFPGPGRCASVPFGKYRGDRRDHSMMVVGQDTKVAAVARSGSRA